MKKLANLLLLFTFYLLPMMAATPQKGYTIKGHLTGNDIEGKTVILCTTTGNFDYQDIDSAVIKNGQFTMKGSLKTPQYVVLRYFPDANRSAASTSGLIQRPCIPLFIGNDNLNIEACVDSLDKDICTFYHTYSYNTVTCTGSATNDLYRQYTEKYSELYQKFYNGSRPYYKYLSNGQDKVPASVGIDAVKVIDEDKANIAAYTRDFILQNSKSLVALQIFSDQMSRFDQATINELENALDAKLKATEAGKAVIAKADIVKATAKGSHFVDYTLVDPQGKEHKLSEYIGKGNYTMLEFWASWCGPCRASIPHLKHVYDIYHKDGFNIVSVSMDSDKSKWLKALEDEKMVWPQLSELNAKGFGEIAKIYNFNGIPYCVFFDPQGNVMMTNSRDSWLDECLSDAYGYKFDDFTVKGNLSDVTDTLVVATSYIGDEQLGKQDIVIAKNGKFEYTTKLTKPGTMILYRPVEQQKGQRSFQQITLPAYAGETAIVSGSTAKYSISGTELLRQYQNVHELDETFNAKNDSLANIYYSLQKNKKTRKQAEAFLEQAQIDLDAETQAMAQDYIRSHGNEDASALLLDNVNPDSLETCIKYLSRNVQNHRMSSYIQAVRERFAAQKAREEAKAALKEGVAAPDFTLKDINGNDFTLSSLYNKGKFIIIDFWGSWCHWCMQGMPEMKKYYDKYKNKVEIVSIDVNDTEKDWKQTVADLGLTWTQVKNDAKDGVPTKYGISGYPTKIVLNPDGTINNVHEGEDPDFYKYLDKLLK